MAPHRCQRAENQGHQDQLAGLDAQIEGEQRQEWRSVAGPQGFGQGAGEAEAVDQAEAEGQPETVGAVNERTRLTAADGAALDLFGYSVAVQDGTFVAGAAGDDVGGNVDQGSAYVFERQREARP